MQRFRTPAGLFTLLVKKGFRQSRLQVEAPGIADSAVVIVVGVVVVIFLMTMLLLRLTLISHKHANLIYRLHLH